MLSPELLMGNPQAPTVLPDAEVQKALAFAVEEYNQQIKCRNYFKQLHLQKAFTQGDTRDEYHLKVEMIKTVCRKTRGRRMNYERIQRCQLPGGNPEKRLCYFKVSPRLPRNETLFTTVACTLVATS
ncbi:cystatin-like [Erythrolamprus reginae]|uniref:cystatin-like n=1 Tax=Erythrolamprus reginae TaxID=121349 RepID=UPI00396CF594